MSRTIDSRVVEMQFDNKQFESNVKTTMSTLDKLKQSLNLTGASDMSGLSRAVESVRMKFSALEVMAVTALANITNSAINAGKRIVSALTIDPIKAGFSEYETKINAIQTIISNTASKGTTMKDVTRVIDELNTYADKTIYNFAEMTRNIGTFTAAGVGLEESAKAIQGIANLAAASGSSSQQASTAMYQLSQALATGTVKLMDWNSVVNAGMGGEKFQEALKQTAREHGIAVDQIIKANGSFRDSLQEGWLSADILNQTLNKFTVDGATNYAKSMMESGKWTQEQADALITEAQAMEDAATKVKTFTQLWDTLKEAAGSGWAKSWEIIIGDFEEAKTLLTEVSEAIGGFINKTSDARNEMLQFWKDNGGRAALIDSFRNSFEALGQILKPIGEAFREIFPSITGAQLVSITEGLKNFTENLKIGDETAKNIKDTFKGFFALLDIGKMALTAIAGGLISLVKALFPVAGSFLSVTGGVGDFIVAIRDALKSSDTFNVVIQNIGKVLKPVAEGIVMFTDLIANAFKAVRAPDMTGIDEFTGQIEKRFQPLIKIGEAFEKFISFFYNLASTIGKILSGLSDSIFKSLNDADFNSIFDFINNGLFAAILYGIKKFIDSLTKITDSAGGFLSGITGIFDGVRGCLAAYQSQLKAGVLLKIAISIGILAAALLTISMIDSEKLTTSLAAMTAMFVELFGAMAVFNAIAGVKGFFAISALTTGMIGLSIAILILASAMKKLSSLDWNGVAKGLAAIAGLTGILVGATKLLETSSKSLIAVSVGFVIFGTAILILTQAVKQLGGLDLADLAKGLVGVGVLMAELVLFMKVADLSGMGAIKSVGILLLAAAITVLAGAVKKLSSINLGDLVKGLSGLAVMLTTILVFLKLSGNAKHVIATAVSLTILGAAMNIFAAAIIKMGAMSWEQMARGLIALGGALAIITVALIAMPKNIFVMSLALLDIAGAMMMLTVVLDAFASMSWEELGRGLLGLAASLVLVVAAFVALAKTGSIVDSSSFVILALGITLLATALKTIGSMSLVQIGAALLGLAGTFAILGVATTLLTPAIPAILGFSAAIALLGIGIVAIGAGILALSTGLAALAVAGTAGTVALVALVTSLIGLIPYAAKTLAEGVIEFARVIGSGAAVVAQAVKDVVLAVMDVMVTLTPVVVDGALTLLTKLLESFVAYLPKIMKLGGELVLILLKGVKSNIKEVVQSGIDIVIDFISGVTKKLGAIIQAGFELMISFLYGLADAVERNGEMVVDAILNLIGKIVLLMAKTLLKAVDKFIEIGGQIVMGLVNGIKEKISSVVEGVTDLATSAIDAAKRVLDTRSPSEVFKEIGDNVAAGLAIGIDKGTPKVEASSEKMTKKAVTAAEKAAAKTAKEAEKAAEDAFNASADWIDERKYYSELSLYEELDAWERVQSRYLEGTEERKKADREVYRVKKEIAQADADFAQGVIDVSRDAMDKRIQYEQEYYEACRQINDQLERDIRDLNAQYDQALKSRTKSLYDTYGLFDKIEPKDEVLGSDLIKNLKDQVNEFDDWTRQMSNLSGRGVDSALIDELQKMGPRSLSEIKALNKLSEPELIEYVSLWQEKSSQARTVATKELEGLRIETSNQIRMANAQARIDLEEQRFIFEEKTKQLAEETAKTIENMKNDWLKKIGELRTKGEKDFRTFADNIVSIMRTPDWMGLGQDIVDGMKWGILSKASELAQAAARTATDALQAARDAIGVASPSKKFAELGRWSMVGFAEGLKKYSHLGMSSAADMGMSTISTLKNVISAISDVINDNADLDPVIRPVLDLSDVEAGSLLINDLLSKNKGINVADVIRKLPTFAASSESDGVNRSETPQETKVSFVQNNYSPKALSRLEIYRQTKNQISTLRGVVGTT
jgi:tape measure domain-containing protein